jgi:hypothetical protein
MSEIEESADKSTLQRRGGNYFGAPGSGVVYAGGHWHDNGGSTGATPMTSAAVIIPMAAALAAVGFANGRL